jgi:hypothetical protein
MRQIVTMLWIYNNQKPTERQPVWPGLVILYQKPLAPPTPAKYTRGHTTITSISSMNKTRIRRPIQQVLYLSSFRLIT